MVKKCVDGRSSNTDPAEGALSAPQVLRGLRAREEKGKEEGTGEKGEGGREKEGERGGEGERCDTPSFS